MTVRKVLWIAGLINLAVMSAKLTVGLVSNSTAIIGDALHSLTDATNNVIALIAIRIAQEPPDREHPYGHHKFEQIAVFALAALLVIVAFELGLNAIKRFGQPVEQSTVGLVIMLATLMVNIMLTSWEHYQARRLDSALLTADASHTLSDVLATLAIIAGWQLSARGYYWLDSCFALGVALLIFYLAFYLFKRSIPILVDHVGNDPVELVREIDKLPEVRHVLRVRSRSSGKEVMADVVVTVDADLSTSQSHLIANAIETLLAEKFNIYDTVVHIEPECRQNEGDL